MGNPLPIPLHVMSGWRTKQRPAHEGIDLTAPVGTPVLSVLSGWVTLVTGNVGAPGNSIIVQHDGDTETRYNHLQSKPKLSRGDRVDEGQLLGHVGMTGRTDAPHLHFARYELRAGRWRDIDPRTLLDFSATAGGDAKPLTPTNEEEDEMLYILERHNAQLAKSLYDVRTGKAIRKIGVEENTAFRAMQAAGDAVYITVDDKEYIERGGLD